MASVLTVSRLWRVWCLSLCEKASDDANEADQIAIMRTIVVLVNFATCFFIVAGVLRHW